ncbi:MAG TPA: histidine--tRNA ligase [Gemmatimonadales bacterium]
MSSAALPGFRDFYPKELAERAHIMRAWREVARRYAFVEYDGPPLEALELYTKKSGDEIVGQLYAFEDRGGRQVSLRPEMTPTFARMVGARANALRKPVRWFSTPQLFRYERQQKGRLREHFQLNVDIVGSSSIAADAELIACAIDVLRELGLTSDDVVARVSDRRVLEAYLRALGVPDGALAGTYGVIDKIERQPRDVSAGKLAAAGVPAGAVDAILDIASVTLDELTERLGSGPAAPLIEDLRLLHRYVPALLGGDEGWLRLDMSIVRGLAYYTGVVFELFDRTGEFRAICGGGRYDNLLASLGGADLPALGFGMGDVVLGELLRSRGLMPDVEPRVDRWLLAEDDVPMERVMEEAARIRAAGCSVEYALEPRSMSKQKKAAQASGATEFVTISTTSPSNG